MLDLLIKNGHVIDPHNNINEVIQRYKLQIKYYKDALEKITGKNVKESYLYLFGIDEERIIRD